MHKLDCLFLAIVLIAILILMVLAVGIIFPGQYEPEEGVWFCKALQIQLSYEQGEETFIIEDGKKIICGCGSDRGVKAVYLFCQEFNHPEYDLDEVIFAAQIIKCNNSLLLVREEKTQQEYTFLRTDPYEPAL